MKYENIIQRSWCDPTFKAQFLGNPKSVLIELGYSISDEVSFDVHEDTFDTMNYVLLNKSQLQSINLDADPILSRITKKAHEDHVFRLKLLTDSKSAIKEILGVEPPGNIKVYENTSNHIHLVLPANPYKTGELSNSDLAMVAGGKTGTFENGLTCGGMEVLFKGIENFGANIDQGFMAALNVVLAPIMVGGVVFSKSASNMQYTRP